jgi:hypothetical protein
VTRDKMEIWRTIQFQVLFNGDDRRGTEKGKKLERELMPLMWRPCTSLTQSQAFETSMANRP